MSTMRNGLNSWLKQECVNIADEIGGILSYTRQAAIANFNNEPYARELARSASIMAERLNNSPQYHLDNDDVTEAYHLILNAANGESPTQNLERATMLLHKINIENIVECQCGGRPVINNITETGFTVKMDRIGNIYIHRSSDPSKSVFLQFESDKDLVLDLLDKEERIDLEKGWYINIKDDEPRASILWEMWNTSAS